MAGPDKAGKLLTKAMNAHRLGRLTEAKGLYEKSLARRPGNPDALHFYGVLQHALGQSTGAVELIQRSLGLVPSNPHAWLNLGNVFMETEQWGRARLAYERATVLAPQMADAWYNLGICLRKSTESSAAAEASAAIAAFDEAVKLRPSHAPTYYQRGVAQRATGLLSAAEVDYRLALQLKPDYVEVYESLGVLLYRQGRNADAAQLYGAWLERDPASNTARHMFAAMSGNHVPERAADGYVTETFDQFAATFDENLAALGYRAPALVANALIAAVGAGERLRTLLDAGCGTGLCGALLRQVAVRLVGVDLSPRMIDRARTKACYDELHVGELCGFMRARALAFDAVVVADTLVYFGALEEAFNAAAQCLNTAGLLVMTLEEMASGRDQPDYRIEPHGRYSHRIEYVRSTLQRAGFELLGSARQILRRERDADVPGLVVTARKQATG